MREAIATKGILPALAGVDVYPADTNGYAVITAGAGLAALAIRPEEPKAAEYLQQCLNKTRVSLDHGGKDGGMFEGPMYGTYLIDSFALFFDGLVSAEVTHDLFDHPYLKTMDRYCIGLLAPDTRQIPCFSDGSPGVAVPKLMSLLAQRGSSGPCNVWPIPFRMYAPVMIRPIIESATCNVNGFQAPRMIMNSLTKPLRPGRPSEAILVKMRMAP